MTRILMTRSSNRKTWISTSNTPNTRTATSSVVVEKLLRLVAIILHYVVLLYLPAHVIRLLYTHQWWPKCSIQRCPSKAKGLITKLWVPTSETIEDIQPRASVQIIDGAFSLEPGYESAGKKPFTIAIKDKPSVGWSWSCSQRVAHSPFPTKCHPL